MALIIGQKSKSVITKERESKVEKLNQISVMSSGIKFRQATLTAMALSVGDKIWYVADEEDGVITDLYVFKATEADKVSLTIGKNHSVIGKDINNSMLEVAGVTNFSNGEQVIFEVATTPIKFEGRNIFKLTFVEYRKDESDEAPVATSVAVEDEDEL